MASDRGLCGPFNGYVIRNTKRQAEVLKAEGKKLLIITIGNKVTEALKNSEFAADIVASHTGIAKGLVGYQDAKLIASSILGIFKQYGAGSCSVLYNHFFSALKQKVEIVEVLPFSAETTKQTLFIVPRHEQFIAAKAPTLELHPSLSGAQLLERDIAACVYGALLHHSASEHGSRMTAMDNATRAAGDMIKRLSLTYNRTRQATITKELIEIISGAEAV